MRSFSISRVFDRHTRSVAAAVGLLLATLVPAIAPAFAAADILTNRSVELSSSTKQATSVTYRFTFTGVDTSAGAVVVQFCSNTPLIGEFCTPPTGFSSSSATVASGGTLSGTPTANKVIIEKSIAAGTNTFELAGITNPTAAGPLYARILTYEDATAAGTYNVAASTTNTLGSPKDQGSVALSITEGVNVSGKVLETLTFCVSGGQDAQNPEVNPITANCGGTTAPTLTLGETVGSVKALSSSAVSTGSIFTQISTNASGGAIVSLKSGNACGGLKRFGQSVCDIAPATTAFTQAGGTTGNARFGLKIAADSTKDTALSATGDFQIHSGSGYDGSNYLLNWTSGSTTAGVSSTYGDPILDTGVTQPSNKNMKLTFGATITNNTPAGNYSTDLSLIATGKF